MIARVKYDNISIEEKVNCDEFIQTLTLKVANVDLDNKNVYEILGLLLKEFDTCDKKYTLEVSRRFQTGLDEDDAAMIVIYHLAYRNRILIYIDENDKNKYRIICEGETFHINDLDLMKYTIVKLTEVRKNG